MFLDGFLTTRFLITWLFLSFFACIIYGFVVFGSLVNKNIIPNNNVPETIPYITVPSTYDIFLDLRNSTINEEFSGNLKLTFTAKDQTQRIFLHRGQLLKITKINLQSSAENFTVLNLGAYNKRTEVQAYIPLTNLTKSSAYDLLIDFEGRFENGFNGFHVNNYFLKNGSQKASFIFCHPLTTMEGLRSLLPCLDSMNFPAFFNLKVRHLSEFQALSNFRGESMTKEDFIETTFNSTFEIIPSQVAFALIDKDIEPETVVANNLTMNKFFLKESLTTISTERVLQFMAPKTGDSGNLNVISLPKISSLQQIGISFLSEHDVLQENIDLGLIPS